MSNYVLIPGSNFSLVSDMNEAFGNKRGMPQALSIKKVSKQCLNIVDELGELFVALGADKTLMAAAVANFKWVAGKTGNPVNMDKARDSLTDIHVFAYGAHHIMGVDADSDMRSVITGVMTRFIKSEADKIDTIAKHAKAGVTEVYFEGQFPSMIMKSAKDQPDAPEGKFLKSASYQEEQLYPVDFVFVD